MNFAKAQSGLAEGEDEKDDRTWYPKKVVFGFSRT